MLTEDRVRRLLDEAAGTIEVRERSVVPPARQRSAWLPGVAAAAVVVLLAAGLVTALLHGGSAATSSSSSGTVSASLPEARATRGVDLYRGDRSFHLGPDQVPSIAGLDATQARLLLERHGYRVLVRRNHGCATAENHLGVTPGTGALASPGATVTLDETVDSPPTIACPSGNQPDPTVRHFLAWARGLGGRPAFAAVVHVETDDEPYGGTTRHRGFTLRGREVTTRSRWPGLTALADALASPSPDQVPLMVTRDDAAAAGSCDPQPGEACADMLGAHIAADDLLLSTSVDYRAVFDVTLQLDAERRITRVVLTDRRARSASGAPDVVGDSAAYATERLEAFGYRVASEEVEGCSQRGLVDSVHVTGKRATIRVSDGTASCTD